MTVITSFLSPGAVYCSRSVCYLPQGLSVECLNLQAPTFLGRIFKSPPTSLLYGPEIRRVSRGSSEVLQRRPKTPTTLSRTDYQSQDRSVTSFISTVFQLASSPTLRLWSRSWEEPESRLTAGFSATFLQFCWSCGR